MAIHDPPPKPDYGPHGGNIDLNTRPAVRNPDGPVSSVRSIGVELDGRSYLIPTVVGHRVVRNDEAIRHWRRTGQHLGVFRTQAAANAYGRELHRLQAARTSG